jgi:glutamate formiminotransferase
MAEKLQTPGFRPDCGDRLHPTAGITAVGARGFLVAYNLYLDTADVSVAKAVARAVRESSGGLRAVKAIGIPCRGTAQVSCNVTDVTVTPLDRLTEAVRREAARHGAAVTDTEVIGLLPEDVLQQFERA